MHPQPSSSSRDLRLRKEALARAIAEKRLREERRRQADLGSSLLTPGEHGGVLRPGGLIHFVRYFWHVLEPSRPLVEGWSLYAICLHLEAVTRGEIKRLLINVPPGFMKSLLCNVFWPAWEWSAAGLPGTRYVTFAYASHLTERDNGKFRDLIQSPEFQELWGDQSEHFRETWGEPLRLVEDGKIKPVNAATGFKFASSVRGVSTGERGDRIINDDLHNVKEQESEPVRSETVRWAREAMPNRLNDMIDGVIVGIGQRVHEEDASNAMLEDGDYVHLMIPMELDPERRCSTAIGWVDPRTYEGELAWPERFPISVVSKLKRTLGPTAYSAQYQQAPQPRGGAIFKRDWWGAYELAIGARPRHRSVLRVASLDPAFTAKQENDPSGFTVWDVYTDDKRDRKILLIQAWQKWLELHGTMVEQLPGEKNKDYVRRASPHWGLVEWVAYECRRLNVHVLLIENKASGHSVAQEMRRLYGDSNWMTHLIDPGAQDKRARAFSVQHIFAAGMVEAPASVDPSNPDVLLYREFAQMVIDEFARFRGLPGEEDNLVDSGVQAIRWLRDRGVARLREERELEEELRARHKPQAEALYPV